MNPQELRWLLLGIIAFDFILERCLHILNRRHASHPIPPELADVYEKEKYNTSRHYQRTLSRFGTVTSSITFTITFSAIALGWFGDLDAWIRSWAPFDMLSTLYFFGILYFASDLLGTPFSWYRTFVIEARFGFNQTTATTFWMDKIKGYVLTLIIGGILLSAFIYLVHRVGSDFWIYFWLLLIAFSLFANFFYATLILPLFNKLKVLDAGELKNALEAYSNKVNFPLKNLFVMDGSKRSSKGNAFFTGLGKKKKVVLFDTLIEKHETDELTAVFAHEVGHYKKKHILIQTVISIPLTGGMLYLLSLMIFSSTVSFAMGGEITAIHLNVLAFGILYSPLSNLTGLFGNWLSRKFEYQADAYAATTSAAQPMINALKKMSQDHYTNLTPHPAYVFVHYSHPPLLKRIRALKTYAT